jgi:hypothetical protein
MDAEMVARVAKLERMEFLASKRMVVHQKRTKSRNISFRSAGIGSANGTHEAT